MDGGDAMAGEEGEAPGARNGRGARRVAPKGWPVSTFPKVASSPLRFIQAVGFPEKLFKSIILYMYPSLRHFYLIY